jgi:hypothetical protein
VQILANRTRPVSPALTNSIGGNNTSAPIYWRRCNHILNRHGGSNLQDVYSVYMSSPIGAVITERNILTPLHLFVVTMPISKAVASGKGISEFYRETKRSNLK